MADSRDITGKNRKFTGTDSIVLPKGSEAQRVASEGGQIRFNTDTNLAEYYNGTDWKPIDSPPTITNFTIDGGSTVTSAAIDNTAGGDATIVINGSLFDTTSGTVVFEPESGGSNVTTQTITRTSANQFTVTVTRADFLEAGDPYAIKLTNGSGLAATLASALDVNVPPTFATAADTNIGTVQNGDTDFSGLTTVAATDADGDTITHTISAGSLPSGMSIQSDGTFTGTIASQGGLTEYTFTVQAATTFHTITRQFKVSGIDSLYLAATGGTVTESGDFKIHTFNNPGSFAVSSAGAADGSNSVEYLVVAGGGGGGGRHGAGGGAGGLRTNYPSPAAAGLPVSATTYPVTVGGGGAHGPDAPGAGAQGSSGNNSVFSTITSAGGGYGVYTNNPYAGGPGGSGGGGGGPGGAGNTPPTSPPQGNNGGNGQGSAPVYGGGGGGGAGAVGTNSASSSQPAGPGGAGSPVSITGSAVTYAGGGGGGYYSPSGPIPSRAGTGGPGGGGRGGSEQPGTAVAGTDNLGGGGGGGPGGTGGKGVVIIRYKFQ